MSPRRPAQLVSAGTLSGGCQALPCLNRLNPKSPVPVGRPCPAQPSLAESHSILSIHLTLSVTFRQASRVQEKKRHGRLAVCFLFLSSKHFGVPANSPVKSSRPVPAAPSPTKKTGYGVTRLLLVLTPCCRGRSLRRSCPPGKRRKACQASQGAGAGLVLKSIPLSLPPRAPLEHASPPQRVSPCSPSTRSNSHAILCFFLTTPLANYCIPDLPDGPTPKRPTFDCR